MESLHFGFLPFLPNLQGGGIPVFSILLKYIYLIFLGRDYFLEKQGEEGHHIDMETTLESTGTLTFNLVRDSGGNFFVLHLTWYGVGLTKVMFFYN